MALVRDEYWLKLAGRERAGKDGKAEKLWRVGKREEVGFKARNKLITGESTLQGWKGAELMTVVEWCVSGAKDLKFIGRAFHMQREELRNERSADLSLVETGGRKRYR